MVGRRGYIAIEALVGMGLAVVVAVSTAAVLRARAEGVRLAYEEAVARELASAALERLEASAFDGLREGRRELDLDAPGAENLAELRGELTVAGEPAGPWAVAVEVSWSPAVGRRRSVRMRTLAGRPP